MSKAKRMARAEQAIKARKFVDDAGSHSRCDCCVPDLGKVTTIPGGLRLALAPRVAF